MKNITLSAPEEILEKARAKARRSGKSLNVSFREWVTDFATQEDQDYKNRLEAHFKKMDALGIDAGRKFTRDEMNER